MFFCLFFFASCYHWAHYPVYRVLFVELAPYAMISDWGHFNMLFCASGLARPRLLFSMKTKWDMAMCGQFINCLGLRLGVCYHVIVTRDYHMII